jgi:hypothetical protein
MNAVPPGSHYPGELSASATFRGRAVLAVPLLDTPNRWGILRGCHLKCQVIRGVWRLRGAWRTSSR